MDGGIKFDVSANTAKFEADMGRVKNAASTTAGAIGKAFSGLGGLFAGGALVAGLTTILRKMDDVSDMARRFGTTAVEIQKVGNAAEIVGTNVDAVARAMNRAGVAANKAAREGGSLAEAFARVDIDPAKFAAAGLEERIKMVAEAQRAANGDAKKMADLFEVIGVRAAGINFAELVAEMDQVSAASDDVVEKLAAANDELDKMKQSATIFGANLIKALLIDPAERIGSLLGGQGFKTVAEVEQQQAKENATSRLIARGELTPDTANTEEGLRRINAEMEKMRQEAEATKKAAQGFVDELEDAAPEADKTTKALERQAQFLEESNAKRRKAYETEVALTEARLAGNKALEESIMQAQDFNQVLEETDSFETAANVTATRAAARKVEEAASASGGDGGGGSGGGLGPSVSGAPMSENMRVAELRGRARGQNANQRAAELASRGMFRSSVRASDREQRRFDEAMARGEMRDIASQFDFDGREAGNIGEAMKSVQDQMGKMGMLDRMRQDPAFDKTKSDAENFSQLARKGIFDDKMRDQAKTPDERRREEEDARNRSRGPGGGGDGGKGQENQSVEGKLSRIVSLMEERLPIRVLAKAA